MVRRIHRLVNPEQLRPHLRSAATPESRIPFRFFRSSSTLLSRTWERSHSSTEVFCPCSPCPISFLWLIKAYPKQLSGVAAHRPLTAAPIPQPILEQNDLT